MRLSKGQHRIVFRDFRPTSNENYYVIYEETSFEALLIEWSSDGTTWSNTQTVIQDLTSATIDSFDAKVRDTGTELHVYVVYIQGDSNVLVYRRLIIGDTDNAPGTVGGISSIATLVDGLTAEPHACSISQTSNGRFVVAYTMDSGTMGQIFRETHLIGCSEATGPELPTWVTGADLTWDDPSADMDNAAKGEVWMATYPFNSTFPNRIILCARLPDGLNSTAYNGTSDYVDWNGTAFTSNNKAGFEGASLDPLKVVSVVIDSTDRAHVIFYDYGAATLSSRKAATAGQNDWESQEAVKANDVDAASLSIDLSASPDELYAFYKDAADSVNFHYKKSPVDTILWGVEQTITIAQDIIALSSAEKEQVNGMHIAGQYGTTVFYHEITIGVLPVEKETVADVLIKALGLEKQVASDTLLLKKDIQKEVVADALLQATFTKDVVADAIIKILGATKDVVSDVIIKILGAEKEVVSDTLLKALGLEETVVADVILKFVRTVEVVSDVLLKKEDVQKTVASDALLQTTFTKDTVADVLVQKLIEKETIADVLIRLLGATRNLVSDVIIILRSEKEIVADVNLKALGVEKQTVTDVILTGLGTEVQIVADVLLRKFNIQKDSIADVLLRKLGLIKDVVADALLQATFTKDVVSDVNLKALGVEKEIVSDVNLKALGVERDIGTDTLLQATLTKDAVADALLRALDLGVNVVADTLLKALGFEASIRSDVILKALSVQAQVRTDTNLRALDLQKDVGGDVILVTEVVLTEYGTIKTEVRDLGREREFDVTDLGSFRSG